MFAAVRTRFRRWDELATEVLTSRRGRRIAALFLFEFVVVLLGVLAAQMLQERAARGRAEADARAAIDRASEEVAGFRSTAEYWLRASSCLADRMDSFMRAAAGGAADSIATEPRPRMPLSALTPWSEATTITARELYGERVVANYSGLATMAAKMAQDSHELAGEWALLGLTNPELGSVTREDRLHARLAASRIKGRLASINVTARNAVEAARRLGVQANPQRSRLLTLPAGCDRQPDV